MCQLAEQVLDIKAVEAALVDPAAVVAQEVTLVMVGVEHRVDHRVFVALVVLAAVLAAVVLLTDTMVLTAAAVLVFMDKAVVVPVAMREPALVPVVPVAVVLEEALEMGHQGEVAALAGHTVLGAVANKPLVVVATVTAVLVRVAQFVLFGLVALVEPHRSHQLA